MLFFDDRNTIYVNVYSGQGILATNRTNFDGDITNLLDTRNANYVYEDTGLPDYTLQDYQNWSRLTEISNSTEYFNNPGMYSAPRFIQLGLGIIYN